jgi:hypothetical protein
MGFVLFYHIRCSFVFFLCLLSPFLSPFFRFFLSFFAC